MALDNHNSCVVLQLGQHVGLGTGAKKNETDGPLRRDTVQTAVQAQQELDQADRVCVPAADNNEIMRHDCPGNSRIEIERCTRHHEGLREPLEASFL